jgi:hypothetical protein
MTDLLQEALIAKESGDLSLAKQLISQVLVQEPNNEAAWMLMSDVVGDVRLRRNCLERVLLINPDNNAASTALTRINTSPLSPISRGERDKPLNPPQLEKVPPFTPPFTWEGDPEEYLDLGDLTYPDLPGEPPTKPPDSVPTFDWANESDEPDKTIQKIFDAVSNPDLASQPLPDTDVTWTDKSSLSRATGATPSSEGEYEAMLLDQLVGPLEEEPLAAQQPLSAQDFTVSAEPQLGLDAFTSAEQALETVTPDYRLWDNPKEKMNRMVILSGKSLVYASPKESDIPHILGLFAENKMLRDLLGENAGVIKLESIHRLTANPNQASLTIEYKNPDEEPSKHELKFSSPQVLDEVLEALQVRLGVGFSQSTHTFSLADKIVPPLVTLLFIAFIGWGLIAGLPLVSRLSGSELGFVQVIVTGLQSFVSSVGVDKLFMVAFVCAALTLIWLLHNLRQPSKLIILER